MNFDFSDDQKFLRDEARKFLEAQCTTAHVREVLDDDSKSHKEGVWKQIGEMGWLGAAVPEEYGGLGLGMLELCVIAEELGRALAPLRDEGVLIVGSGLSYHNLRLMGPEAREPSAAFDVWLNGAMRLPPAERTQAMLKWESAPAARICHPQEDHLVPLFVALGAAEDEAAAVPYHETTMMGGVTASNFRFG